jgi:thiol-disulfide isomerase/thioredoxin
VPAGDTTSMAKPLAIPMRLSCPFGKTAAPPLSSILPRISPAYLRFKSSKHALPKPRFLHRQSRSTTTATANQILSPINTPPTFHDYLNLASTNNTLLLLLFTTSSCAPCRTICPLLQSLISSRKELPADRFAGLAFAEVELDSPDRSNGPVANLGMEYGITSLPTLAGFGGRRAERVTEKVVDTKLMANRERMEAWLDEWMEKGDPSGTGTGADGGMGRNGLLGRVFGRAGSQ